VGWGVAGGCRVMVVSLSFGLMHSKSPACSHTGLGLHTAGCLGCVGC
jgi:hypothetical protein